MITMNRKQLLAIFRYLKVPCDTYDLGTSMRIEACYDVEYTEQGWEMCRFDRGKKTALKSLTTKPMHVLRSLTM